MAAWLAIAHAEMGVTEVPGPTENPRIRDYYTACGATWPEDDSVPWCGAFLGYLMIAANQRLPAEPLRARSWLDWGKAIDAPIPGCIVITKRGTDPKSGHVCLFVQKGKNSKWLVLGGNQGNTVSVISINPDVVIGLRWPSDVPVAPPKPEHSRIVKTAQGVKTDGAVVAAGSAGAAVVQTSTTTPPPPPVNPVDAIPNPIAVPQMDAWTSFTRGLKDFSLFAADNWLWVAAAIGAYLVLSGAAIRYLRQEDAETGKTWDFGG